MKHLLILLLLTGMMFSGYSLSVVIPEKADAVTLNAADELVYHLGQVMKKKIPIIREGSAVMGAKIFLGTTQFAQKNGVRFFSFGMEESLIRSCGDPFKIAHEYSYHLPPLGGEKCEIFKQRCALSV